MRALLVALVAGCAATTPDAPLEVCWPVSASHATTWQAACRAAIWEGATRVDSATWEVRCRNGIVCCAPPARDAHGQLWVGLSVPVGTLIADIYRFEERFFVALDMLERGAEVGAEAPATPDRLAYRIPQPRYGGVTRRG